MNKTGIKGMLLRMRKQSLLLDKIRKKNIDKVALEVALETVCQMKMKKQRIREGRNEE